MFVCFQYEPKARPLFPEIVEKLAEVKVGLDDAAWRCHTPSTAERYVLVFIICMRFVYLYVRNTKYRVLLQRGSGLVRASLMPGAVRVAAPAAVQV